MPRNFEIEIKPEILTWAINNSGWTKEEIANKLKITIDSLDGWLDKTKKPTLKQLENLAQILKRPLAAFFLSEPPEDLPKPKDYRMIPNRRNKFDNKTMLAIRRARRLQRISKELSENLKTELETETTLVRLSDEPKKIAQRYIYIFKINEETRKSWKTPYNAFNYLRNLIENMKILVFKMSMLTEDARGFTLTDDDPSIIVVNSKDLPEAQVFSLLHEFGHVLLNKTGISMPDNVLFKREDNKVEKWCNEFSSAILLPEEIAKSAFDKYKRNLIGSLGLLSRKFKLSKAMLLYNMKKLNYITSDQYNTILKKYNPLKSVVKTGKKKKGGGVSADKRCMSEKGQTFVSLVSKNVNKGHITRNDALDFLSIKSRHLDKVMSKAKK